MTALTEKTINHFVAKLQTGDLTEEQLRELITEVHTQAVNTPKRKTLTEVLHNSLKHDATLQERIDFYNEVTVNTLRKLPMFNSVDIPKIPKDAKLYGVTRTDAVSGRVNTHGVVALEKGTDTIKYDDIIVFSYQVAKLTDGARPRVHVTTERVSVPAAHLWNDPVAIAQHVRKVAAERINSDGDEFVQVAEEALAKAKTSYENEEARVTKAKEEIAASKAKQAAVVKLREARKAKSKAVKEAKKNS
jgi:hypothetical protein